jgi:hypothetical protein
MVSQSTLRGPAPDAKLRIGLLTRAHEGRFVVQDYARFPQSVEWELGQACLNACGAKGFVQDKAPISWAINNDGILSGNAADLFFQSLLAYRTRTENQEYYQRGRLILPEPAGRRRRRKPGAGYLRSGTWHRRRPVRPLLSGRLSRTLPRGGRVITTGSSTSLVITAAGCSWTRAGMASSKITPAATCCGRSA